MSDPAPEQSRADDCPPEHVWSFRGYRLSAREFTTAMVHLYRGEITRSNTWRTRLDSTTNWAVVSTGAALTLAFGSSANPHYVILFVMLLVILFLYIEARRYRYYELWAYRVRLMETDFYAAMLVPPFAPAKEWAGRLADSLLHPEFPITTWEALGRRLRRNYLWLLGLLTLSWLTKLALHPGPAASAAEFVERAGLGGAEGRWVLGAVLLIDGLALILGLGTVRLQQSAGEVLPDQVSPLLARRWWRAVREVPTELYPVSRIQADWPLLRRERLSIIITSQGQEIADRLMQELKRGVTSLDATGMYTGEDRSVLLCATHPAQVHQLKAIVYTADPDAFVVINPAQEIVGKGFSLPRKTGQ